MSRAVKGSLSRSHDIPWHTPACPVQWCQASSCGVTWLCSHGKINGMRSSNASMVGAHTGEPAKWKPRFAKVSVRLIENLTSIQPFTHVFCAPGHPTTDDLAKTLHAVAGWHRLMIRLHRFVITSPQYRLGARAARPGPSPTFRLSGVGARDICWTRRTFHLVLSITYVLASALQRTHSTTRLGFTPAL